MRRHEFIGLINEFTRIPNCADDLWLSVEISTQCYLPLFVNCSTHMIFDFDIYLCALNEDGRYSV